MHREVHWYKEAIIYELHVKCFYDSVGDGIGNFQGLTEKLDYLQDLGITAIWLLPFYPSPLKDDGYDISDYNDIHPHYGTLKDFKLFLREAHKRGLRVITEVVVNHTSDQHPWFQRARLAPEGSNYRDFYVWNDSPDKYKEARIIFKDFESSNWTWDPVAKSYYWHRFYSHQPDLNFDNPEVRKAIFKIVSYWMKMGVDGVRLDAVPYLYERDGTNCENLPETHDFLKELRQYVDDHFEDRMLLAEANQWPEDASKYFGVGDECQMAFHFPVMPRLFMSIYLEDALPIIEIMGQTPQIPHSCQWALFLRNHDELTLEMVTDVERDYMFRFYAHDPQARINLGIRRRLAPLLKNDRRKIELMNSLLFSLTGTPVLYYGDEIGMGDNIYLGDRDGVRTPMQWSSDRNAGFSRTNPQRLYLPPIVDPEYHFETVNIEAQQNNPYSLLWWTKQLIALRKRYKAFGYGTTKFLLPENRKILVFLREYKQELIMIVANLSRFPQYVELDLSKYDGYHLIGLFSGQRFPNIGELPYFLTLGPYGYYWFALEKEPKKSALALKQIKKEREVALVSMKGDSRRIFNKQMRRLLESSVRRYLIKKEVFRGKVASIERAKTRIVDHFSIPTKNELQLHIVIIQAVLANGVVERYPIFLTVYKNDRARNILKEAPEYVVAEFERSSGREPSILCDITHSLETAKIMVNFINKSRKMKGESGEIKGVSLAQKSEISPFLNLGKDFGDITREKGAIVFPLEKGVLKIFSFLEEGGMNLDIEMRSHLMTKTSFKGFMPLVGYLEYLGPDNVSVALSEEIATYHKEFPAKELAIEEAERYLIRMETKSEEMPEELIKPKESWLTLSSGSLHREVHQIIEGYLEVARHLGETTAEFHIAMASSSEDPNFAPAPFNLFYQRSVYQTIRRKTAEAFGHLKMMESTVSLDLKKEIKKIGSFEQKILARMHILLKKKMHAKRLRYHGTYKLENLLYTGKEFLITNFEGSPEYSYGERKYKRSPLIDIASMLFSFTEASFFAIYRLRERGMMTDHHLKTLYNWAYSWSVWTGSSFLRYYLKKIGKSSFLPEDSQEIDFLLGLFLIEQCFEKICEEGRSGSLNVEVPVILLLNLLPIYDKIRLQ